MAGFGELEAGIQYALFNSASDNSHLSPQLITNSASDNVLEHLLEELDQAESFIFVVAFITESGLVSLKSKFADLARRGIKGRLITANYLNFNQPKVFWELLKIKNLSVKISSVTALHTKAYIFTKGDYHSIIVGSANLTQNALKRNGEWNLKIISKATGQLGQDVLQEAETLWADATPLSAEWINDYQAFWQAQQQVQQPSQATSPTYTAQIKPNQMQARALLALENTRLQGAQRGLVVSATGTGKTYLAAFEVQQAKVQHLLFIVHREQILMSALASFRRILGGPASDYGILSGNQHDMQARYTFATVNMMASPSILAAFSADYFDYIIIDEAHRVTLSKQAGQTTMYERILAHFTPKFMLGMTATPERTDGINVYEYFDNNIVYEVSLLDALAANLLTPFHYIGVSDFELNGQIIDDQTQLKYLVAPERVDYLLAKTAYYGYSGEQLHGLIFVSRITEGEALAVELTQRGVASQFVSGQQPLAERLDAVQALRAGKLKYLITVDIFNEGIDIVEINQIVMMRPTTSKIIFLQQLGRGLRKNIGKDYVTVIDFIGNYQNNYLIPLALGQQLHTDKEQLINTVLAPTISGVSTINFEELAQTRLLNGIRATDLKASQRFKTAFSTVADKSGKALPMLTDFLRFASVTLDDIVEKYTTVQNMQAKFAKGVAVPTFTPAQSAWLIFFSKEIANSKRINEVAVLRLLVKKRVITDAEIIESFEKHQFFYDSETLDSVERVLNYTYFLTVTAKKFGAQAPVERQAGRWQFTSDFAQNLAENMDFAAYINDTIEAAWQQLLEFTDNQVRFEIGNRYYRRDIIKGFAWEKEQTGLVVSGYIKRTDARFLPIFITINRDRAINSVDYTNEFLAENRLTFYSKSQRTLHSPIEQQLAAQENYGVLQVFMRWSDETVKDTKSFYYLGSAKVLSAKEISMQDNAGQATALIKFVLQLAQPVQHALYKRLLS
ncbi:hypothetical protein WOSG25_080640 [Weissella oryzae SG25]|uniref:Helicase n=1 Tax=Weissella oryzae (strain DSM 25784 / JCM 18191 / LMG 30913 / SG25) TaxID=1329250 RepID=A0A069CV15_WEIOS|nr:DEAD/DEAH box helicase [Weissella oryzae]GAK31232.1 hypothetical protein WOSG25_080640 [Weissella oryzae SG25]